MSLHSILKWAAVIAVVSWIVSNPQGAADMITTIFGGIVTFFKALISGITSAFH